MAIGESKINSARGLVACLLLTAASPALAYVGPGAGLSALGTFLALVGSVLLMILGFLWYPVKRLLRKRKRPSVDDPDEGQEDADQPSTGP